MGKIKLYIAQSLNGKIAQKDGSVDWLNAVPNPEKTDYGFARFFESVGITVQGFNTYNQVINWDIEFPYKGKVNYVFTRNRNRKNTSFVTFISENHFDFIQNLKNESKEDIWLIGGGQLNTWFLNNKFVDEIYVFLMPVILTEGIEIFELLPKETQLELFDSKIYKSGVAELKYKIVK
jgi:dihydrofolate reductase